MSTSFAQLGVPSFVCDALARRDITQPFEIQAATARLRRAAVQGMRLIGEPITFALPSAEAAGLLSPAGFDLRDLAPGPRLTTRFATGGRTCDDGLYVVAAGLR